jgi:cell division septal protein FtsQ
MITVSKKIKLIIVGIIISGIGFFVVVNYTDACRLENVVLNGESVKNWPVRLGFKENEALVQCPVDSVAKVLLAKEKIFKVDVAYHLPNELEIKTNNFKPVCFVIGQESGKMFGLDDAGRLIGLENAEIDWEQPIFTGVNTGDMFSYCDDYRVPTAISQLEEIRNNQIDVFRLIDEIDFSNKGYLVASLSGLDLKFWVRADKLMEDMNRMVEFIHKYDTDISNLDYLDLRYDDMIICAEVKR